MTSVNIFFNIIQRLFESNDLFKCLYFFQKNYAQISLKDYSLVKVNLEWILFVKTTFERSEGESNEIFFI